MKIIAYDYDAQRWIEGEPARLLLLRQLSEELELLQSPRAQEYMDFGRKRGQPRISVQEAQGRVQGEIERLQCMHAGR